jgi:hypothetical protein
VASYTVYILYKNTKHKDHRHRGALWYDFLLSLLLHLFHFLIFFFHLKQEHEEGHRLLHYLKQTNTALATGTRTRTHKHTHTHTYIYIYINVYVINQKTVDITLNVYNTEISLKVTQESVTFWVFCRLFVIVGIIYVMFILDIISIRFTFYT